MTNQPDLTFVAAILRITNSAAFQSQNKSVLARYPYLTEGGQSQGIYTQLSRLWEIKDQIESSRETLNMPEPLDGSFIQLHPTSIFMVSGRRQASSPRQRF